MPLHHVLEDRKDEKIVIRCRKNTKKIFKVFVAERGFESYEEALLYLLKLAKAIV